MENKTNLKALFPVGSILTSEKMGKLVDNMHGVESGITFAALKTMETNGELLSGQAYDVIDFHPKYLAKYPSTFFTEPNARPLRFFAKKSNQLSKFGEMIDEDFTFEFDFATSETFPQGRITKIEGQGYKGKILQGQKVYWTESDGFNCSVSDFNLFQNDVLGGGNELFGELVRIDASSKNIKISEGCFNQSFLGRNLDIHVDYGCQRQIFGDRSNGQRIGQGCSGQIFGYYCIGQVIGFSCNNQVFGDNCVGQTFENGCNGQILPNGCVSGHFSKNIPYIDFSSSTHIMQGKTCNIVLDENGVAKLTYIDSSGIIQAVDPAS